MPKVTVIPPTVQRDSDKHRVAVYCRVSTTSACQHNSYLVQMTYYQNKFQNSGREILTKIYADEGISATGSQNREDFQRMMHDCRIGQIDRIYTKSVSRFARNIKECLQYVRELKTLGISVFFEKELIDTANMSDELLLTIMGGLAQEESISLSQNLKWSIRKRMKNGTYHSANSAYGYNYVNGKAVIHEQEAKIIRHIFSWYLSGNGCHKIVGMLNEQRVPAPSGRGNWSPPTVLYILKNVSYIGDSLFQKIYTTDTPPFKKIKNHGEREQYYVTNTHEKIVTPQTFRAVQTLLDTRRREIPEKQENPLIGKIVCGHCSHKWVPKPEGKKTVWICQTHMRQPKNCPQKIVSQKKIYTAFVNMFNKLCACWENIIPPLQKGLAELATQKTAENPRVADIRNEIAELYRQNHKLASLRAKGLLDYVKFQENSSGLLRKIGKLKSELSKILSDNENETAVRQLTALEKLLCQYPDGIVEFRSDLFEEIVEKITINSQSEFVFHLTGGLKLTFRI